MLDTDNGEPHQIKTNQAKKKWLAVLSLAQLSPSLSGIFLHMFVEKNELELFEIALKHNKNIYLLNFGWG